MGNRRTTQTTTAATAARAHTDWPNQAPGAASDRPGASHAVLAMQSTAGNRAVTALLTRRVTLQRKSGAERLRESSGAPVVPGAADVGGWAGADKSGPGWNASGHVVGGVRRIPVDGLTGGLDGPVTGGASGKMTSEAADHRAIAVLPKALAAGKDVDVLVHLHGYAEDAGSRPYAGWRQHTGGQVRDVDLDRVEAQLDGVARPQLMAVLPQGGERSQFGGADGDYSMKFGPYLADVLRRLAELHAFTGDKAPAVGQVIVGAHSGGGHTTAALLRRGGRIGDAKHPEQGRLGEVALFEALNSPGEVSATWNWVHDELNRLRKALVSGIDAAKKDELVANAPRLRAYSRPTGGYGTRHRTLETKIADWHKANGSDLGGWSERVADLHRVVWSKVGHEHQVRERLDDALRALGNPALDRVATARVTAPIPGAATTGATGATGAKAGGATSTAVPGQAGGTPTAPRAVAADSAGRPDPMLRMIVTVLLAGGVSDQIDLTDAVFGVVHPELGGKAIPAGQTALQGEWRALRRDVVRPVLAAAAAKTGAGAGTPATGSKPRTTDPTSTGTPVAGPTKSAKAPKAPGDLGHGGAGKAATEKQVAAHPAEAAEWAQLASKVQGSFSGGFAKYVAVRGLYAKRLNGASPVDWLNKLDFSFSFCGFRLAGLDSRLTSKLTAIEEEAMVIVEKVRAADAPVNFQGAFQPRATTDKPDSLSDHALGLALHLNYKNNPYLGRVGKSGSAAAPIIEKIAALAGHPDFWAVVNGKKKKQSAHERLVGNYHALADASDAVAAYFSAMGGLEGEEKATRQAEYEIVKKANSGRDPAKGFFAHTSHKDGDPMLQLVLLLAEKAGLQWGGIYNSRPKDLHHFALKV